VAVTDEALRDPKVRFIDAAYCYSMVHRDCASRMDAIASNAESHGTLVHAIHAACSCGTDRTCRQAGVNVITAAAHGDYYSAFATATWITVIASVARAIACASAPHLA
jgi:hypothetical protein